MKARRIVLIIATLAVAILSTCRFVRADDEGATPLQGKWRVVSAKHNGGRVPKDRIGRMFVDVEKDEIHVYVDGTKSEQRARFVVDPKQDPKQINFIKEIRDNEWGESPVSKMFHRYKWAEDKPVATDGQVEGIYKLDGDVLTLCWRTTEAYEIREGKVSKEQKVRPSEFRSDLYYHQFLYVLERVPSR